MENLHAGDLVRITLVGRIAEVYRSGDYLISVHGEQVPILKSQVTEVLVQAEEMEKKGTNQ